ncbi:MAG: ABC transporter permease [Oscillospiraceae bacterium]|nr:ABC transporter permease [Oscillospiraceae bacterium]
MPRLTRFQKIRQSRPFLLIALTVLVLLILLLNNGKEVFNGGNATQLMNRLSYQGLFVTAMACLLMSGGFDFSIASQAALCTIFFADFVTFYPNVPWIVFALVVMAMAACMGLINAFFSQVLNLMPFICTIGMSSVWLGVANWYSRGLAKAVNVQSFSAVASSRLFNSPIPLTFVFMILVIVLYSLLLKYTRFGRSVMVAGGNPTAARLAGLDPRKIKTALYVNASVIAVIAGLIYTAQQRSAATGGLPQATPEMRGLTSSMLGGVSFMGGAGGLTGAFFGIILIETLAYSLTIMNLPAWFVLFVNGMLLVVALTVDSVATKTRMRRLGIRSSGAGGMVMPGMSR